MTEYRRLISYMYEYEGKEKGKNVGFVKLETKNGQCRLSVNVKRMYTGGNAIGVYLMSKTGEHIFLGTIFVRNGGGEFRTTVDAENVEGSGVGLDGYYGLTVHDVKSTWRSYTTVWEDAVVPVLETTEQDMTELDTDRKCDPDQETGPTAQDVLPGSEDVREVRIIPSVVREIEDEIARSAELHPESRNEDGSKTVVDEKEHVKVTATVKEQVKEQGKEGAFQLEDSEILRYLQESEETVPDPEELWQELRKTYPKIHPFDYDGGSEVLTIRPQDIGKLPRENWIYGNNSFLLHGYYNYRYLILIRLEKTGEAVRYLIGVPGHYYSNEKYMATMFGFPNFVLSKKQPPNDGRFGYWYTDIKMR